MKSAEAQRGRQPVNGGRRVVEGVTCIASTPPTRKAEIEAEQGQMFFLEAAKVHAEAAGEAERAADIEGRIAAVASKWTSWRREEVSGE